MKLSKARYKFGGAMRMKNIAGTDVKRQNQMSSFVKKHAKQAEEHYSPVEGEKPTPRLDTPMRKGGRMRRAEGGRVRPMGGARPGVDYISEDSHKAAQDHERQALKDTEGVGQLLATSATTGLTARGIGKDMKSGDIPSKGFPRVMRNLSRAISGASGILTLGGVAHRAEELGKADRLMKGDASPEDRGHEDRKRGGAIKRAEGGRVPDGKRLVSFYAGGKVPAFKSGGRVKREGGGTVPARDANPEDRVSADSIKEAQRLEERGMSKMGGGLKKQLGFGVPAAIGGAALAAKTGGARSLRHKIGEAIAGLGIGASSAAAYPNYKQGLDEISEAGRLRRGRMSTQQSEQADRKSGGRVKRAAGGSVKEEEDEIEAPSDKMKDNPNPGMTVSKDSQRFASRKLASGLSKGFGGGAMSIIGAINTGKGRVLTGPAQKSMGEDMLKSAGEDLDAGYRAKKGLPQKGNELGDEVPDDTRREALNGITGNRKQKKGVGASGSFAAGGWIKSATANKGALHRKLGVPEGEKIPAKKLDKAEHSSDPTTRKEANLAETLKGMKK